MSWVLLFFFVFFSYFRRVVAVVSPTSHFELLAVTLSWYLLDPIFISTEKKEQVFNDLNQQ